MADQNATETVESMQVKNDMLQENLEKHGEDRRLLEKMVQKAISILKEADEQIKFESAVMNDESSLTWEQAAYKLIKEMVSG